MNSMLLGALQGADRILCTVLPCQRVPLIHRARAPGKIRNRRAVAGWLYQWHATVRSLSFKETVPAIHRTASKIAIRTRHRLS